MQVGSTRLGDLELDDDSIVWFTNGLLGFEPYRCYALVDHDGSGVYWWLQSTEDPDLSFLAVVPWPFFPDYEPEIDAHAESTLELDDPVDAMVLCLVTVRDAGDEPGVTANLLGPIVMNTRTRVASQVVLHDGDWPVRAELVAG